ncbi:unnamed protein product [Alopecurus aequalis]
MDPQDSSSFTKRDLERMLHDEAAEPRALPFSLLEEITNDFSYKNEIGRGGFAVVYKGVLENGVVAVKRLSNTYMYQNEFLQEVECLMKVKHKNIVRFLGYCSDTQGSMQMHKGKWVMADVQQRLLCFEYLPNGSLEGYIEDASGGLEWSTRCRIITGICEGLHSLHHINVMHLDLKPGNILMDDNFIPKITDFGLSRSLEELETRLVATKMFGTPGYLAPEFTSHVITHKFDLYSLGVIVTEILTGGKECQAIEEILEIWDKRLEVSQGYQHREQIRVCAEIGIECTNEDPEKRPDSMKDIMDLLAETESMEVNRVAPGPNELLTVHPLKLFLPFEYKKPTPCSLDLTNNTNEAVAFRLIMDDLKQHSTDCFVWLPVNGIVPPRSTCTLIVTTKSQEEQTAARNDLILENTTLALGDEQMFQSQPDKFLEKAKDTGLNVVQVVRLKAIRTTPPKPISPQIKMLSTDWQISPVIYSLDTNNDRQWIITGQDHGHVRIWNNQTQKLVSSFKVCSGEVTGVKFIARKQWFVAATYHGVIHVYNCETNMQKITSFGASENWCSVSLAIHPTQPYLLSSHYNTVKLWDWDMDWKCTQTFYRKGAYNIYPVVFNPTDTIASTSDDHEVKVWTLNSPKSSYTLAGHLDKVNCLDFFTCYDKEYLVTGSDDHTAKIWDLQEKKCIRTLEASMSPVVAVLYEPKLRILITGSRDGCIYLWCATNSRMNMCSPSLERVVNIGSGGAIHSLAYLMGRIVIGQQKTIAIMGMDNNLVESTDNYSEALSTAYNNYTTIQARGTICKAMPSISQLLDVALELIRLPCETIAWLVYLKNSTDKHVTFMLMEDKRSGIIKVLAEEPIYGIVPSSSSYCLIVSTTKEELARAQETNLDLILQSSTSGVYYARLFWDVIECREFFEDAKEMGNDVQAVAVSLKADYHEALQLGESTKSKALIPARIKIISMKNTDDELCCLDAHPTEHWIITGHVSGYVCTWNHEMQGPMDKFQVSERSVTCVKVIARKQWIVAVSGGSVNVYNWACATKMQKMTSFRDNSYYAKSLSVHPVQPFVFSSSGKIWDWDKGWEEVQGFLYSGACQVAFNPVDTDSYAFPSQNTVEVRRIDYVDHILSGHLDRVNCLHFFARDDRQYLVTGSNDCTAKIWDCQKMECIHTMESIMSPVTCVISLPDRPYLITGSEHGIVQLWSSSNFRLERTVHLGVAAHRYKRSILSLVCLMGSQRVAVGQMHAISIIEIDN